MSQNNDDLFTEEEKEILQEIMNIAFGNATADMAGVIDIYVVLSIPKIDVISIGALPEYLRETIAASSETSIVDQKFWGDFNGSGFLVFPAGAETDLITFIEEKSDKKTPQKQDRIVEHEILSEIGNILIGACVGKMSDLLNTFVTYSPPVIIRGNSTEYNYLIEQFDPKQQAIVMKTLFKFKQNNVDGLLLILTNQESIRWLRKSLMDFMDSYE